MPAENDGRYLPCVCTSCFAVQTHTYLTIFLCPCPCIIRHTHTIFYHTNVIHVLQVYIYFFFKCLHKLIFIWSCTCITHNTHTIFHHTNAIHAYYRYIFFFFGNDKKFIKKRNIHIICTVLQ